MFLCSEEDTHFINLPKNLGCENPDLLGKPWSQTNLHMFLHLHGAKSGANEVQFAHGFAPTWLQTRCNLHMFLHLHGAHEVHIAHGLAPRW